MTATPLPPNTVAPHVSIRLKLTPKAPVQEVEPVTVTAPCVEDCGDPLTRCAKLYAGWNLFVDDVAFDIVTDTLPNAAFTLRIVPAGSTELCPLALFVDGDPLTTFVAYAGGTDPADATADFEIAFDFESFEFVLTATGAGNYEGGQLAVLFSATQSTCELYPGESYEFGPGLYFNFIPAP